MLKGGPQDDDYPRLANEDPISSGLEGNLAGSQGPLCRARMMLYIYIYIYIYGRPGSSVGMATDYGLDGPGSNTGGDENFRPS